MHYMLICWHCFINLQQITRKHC